MHTLMILIGLGIAAIHANTRSATLPPPTSPTWLKLVRTVGADLEERIA
jgi:hypothetical protein